MASAQELFEVVVRLFGLASVVGWCWVATVATYKSTWCNRGERPSWPCATPCASALLALRRCGDTLR
eukprot:9392612-Pyramimonas_sp.AAC.1